MSAPQQYDANDILFGGGVPSAKFDHPGDTYAGRIVKLDAVQARKFENGKPTNELDFWKDGSPKLVAVVTLATDHRDASDPSDDGQRKVYLAGRDLQAKVRAAVKGAGKRALEVGGYLSVTFIKEEKQESGLYAKIYEADYRPADPGAQAAEVALAGFAQRELVGQAQVPSVQQTMARPVQTGDVPAAQNPQPVVATNGANAAPANLDSLPPEARAMVERMLAQQQS